MVYPAVLNISSQIMLIVFILFIWVQVSLPRKTMGRANALHTIIFKIS